MPLLPAVVPDLKTVPGSEQMLTCLGGLKGREGSWDMGCLGHYSLGEEAEEPGSPVRLSEHGNGLLRSHLG